MSDTIAAYDPAVDAPGHHHPVYDYDSGPPVERGKFAIWLFLATEVMFFSGLIGSYIVLRTASATWPNPHERLHLRDRFVFRAATGGEPDPPGFLRPQLRSRRLPEICT